MKNIHFIWGDKLKYHVRYGEQAEIYFEKYKNKIRKSVTTLTEMRFFDIDDIELDNVAPDLIIAEDEIDTIVDLVKSAVKSELVSTILICDDLKILLQVLKKRIKSPKLITLDFLFDGLKNPAHKKGLKSTMEAYVAVKKSVWSDVPILGITNYLEAPEAVELKETLRKHGDDLYNKAAIFEALPYIIENRIEYFKLARIKENTSSGHPISEIIIELNKALIDKGLVLEAEKKTSKIIKLLDLQEKVLTFIFENDLKYKSTSLAGAMLYCENNPEAELTEILLTHLNTTSRDIYNNYKLPEQPLASIQKYFKAFDETGIITKESLIIIQLLKKYPDKWLVSLNKAKQKIPGSFTFVTFLDNIIVLL